MEAAAGLFFSLIALAVFGFGIAVLYRNRASVSKWLNAPYYADEDRKLRLKRRIEDSQKELADIEQKEVETKEEE